MEEKSQSGISQADLYRREIAQLTKEKYTLYKRIKELVDENNMLKWERDEDQYTRRVDIIGQNGNTGEHYEVVDEQNRNK
jgi:regulator of replication initiation timing|tara:strand:+ start:65 stop:304 length:240 start_codon:yes stop_codon:yes gene_type:complete